VEHRGLPDPGSRRDLVNGHIGGRMIAQQVFGACAIVIRGQGAPDVLKLEAVPEEAVPEPAAGPGQVLIRTEAVGVSYSEVPLRSGTYPLLAAMPTLFGFEAAGIVAATGRADAAVSFSTTASSTTASSTRASRLAVRALPPVPPAAPFLRCVIPDR
jgi:hypothetical protein